MGRIWIQEFNAGLDVRKLEESSPSNSLIVGENGFINEGGAFEKREAFTPVGDLPADAYGLTSIPPPEDGIAETVGVFCIDAEPPNLPSSVEAIIVPQQTPAITPDEAVFFADSAVITTRLAGTGGRSPRVIEIDQNGRGSVVATGDAFSGIEYATSGLQKIIAVGGTQIQFSDINAPTQFDTDPNNGTGAGFIETSSHVPREPRLSAVVSYLNRWAIFGYRTVQIWSFDVDPTLNTPAQFLQNTGTLSGKSVTSFGDADVFYLARSGIRSLRSRSQTDAAYATDIGSPIDTLVKETLGTDPGAAGQNAIGLIEPKTGQFWMILNNKIFVLSFFTNSNISAWTVYTLPFNATHAAIVNDVVFLRSSTTLYRYGAQGGATVYDDTVATAQLAYLNANDPSGVKTWDGVDVAARGIWDVKAGYDLTNPDTLDSVARINSTTYDSDQIPIDSESTHASLRFSSVGSDRAVLQGAVLHFTSHSPGDNA